MASWICSWTARTGCDVLVQNELELLDGVVVGRVRGDDLEDVAFEGERQHDVFAGHRLGHQFDDRLGDFDVGQVDELQARGARRWPTWTRPRLT